MDIIVDQVIENSRCLLYQSNNSQKNRIIQSMSSMFDDETTSEYKDIGKRVLNQLKTYTFLIYYELAHLKGEFKGMNLQVVSTLTQKLSFKLKQDKNQYSDKYGEYSKNVQLSFYDIENENQISNSLHDLKVSTQESKTKLIFFSSEAMMVNFYHKAKIANISIQNIPICIYTSGIHGDFSRFLGWGEPSIYNLSQLSVNHIQSDVRKWVESPAEKIDIWSVQIKVSDEGGSIQKLNDRNGNFQKCKLSSHKQLFLSNLSVGYHPQLLLEYQQKKTSKQPSFFNKLMYSFEGFKKFCCVGDADMRESTGVVKVDFVDEKGGHQIMKYLRDLQRDQQSEYLAKNKSANRKKVLSIVLSNIDRFFGQKIRNNQGSKMNDQKLQLITFQSLKQATKISSVSGQINMQFTPDHAVYVHINDSCYRLEKPLALKIESFGKAKIIINKQTLNC